MIPIKRFKNKYIVSGMADKEVYGVYDATTDVLLQNEKIKGNFASMIATDKYLIAAEQDTGKV